MMHNDPLFPFQRDGYPIMTFRVFDGWGNCISEYTGTLPEWQAEVAPKLVAKAADKAVQHLRVVK